MASCRIIGAVWSEEKSLTSQLVPYIIGKEARSLTIVYAVKFSHVARKEVKPQRLAMRLSKRIRMHTM